MPTDPCPDWLRLELDLTRSGAGQVPVVPEGLVLSDLAGLGDHGGHRRVLYELNRELSADIPGRGPFYSWPAYLAERLEVPSFDPAGVLVVLDGDRWVGMSVIAVHDGFGFVEMTGVRRSHRRRGLARTLKLAGHGFARRRGLPVLRTVHHPENVAMISLNRDLGYERVAGWDPW